MDDVADLLQPSLTPADDGVGFDRPWDPDWVAWLVILIGPFGAGCLMWLNQRRLGLGAGLGMWAAMAVVGLVAFLAVTVAAPWLYGGPISRDAARVLRYASNLFALPLAFWLLRQQRRRFFIASTLDVPTGRLLRPAVLAGLFNLVVFVALLAIVTRAGARV